jgi:hypothetical protein
MAAVLICLKPAQAATDPLDPSYMPAIDTNPADYPSNIWVTGSLEKVFQNTGSPGTVHWAIVYATQNEFQSFQVHVQAPAGGIANLSVTMSDLVNSRTGTHISASSTDIVVYREAYQNITNKSSISPTYYNSTGFIPDILIPAVDPYYHQTTNAFPFTVAANQNQSVWIDVHVPPTAPSGYYSGTMTVKSGSTTLATLPVLYAVWSWKMPSTASLRSWTNIGYGANGFCLVWYGSATGCNQYPGALYNGSPSYDYGVTLAMYDAAVQFLDNRISLSGATNVYNQESAGDFTKFDAVYGPLLDGTGGPSYVGSDSGGQPISDNVTTILPGAKWTTINLHLANPLASSQATFQNFATHFTAKGWFTDRLFYYLCDEPPSQCSWAQLQANGSLVHSYSTPIVPNLVTTNMNYATDNGVQNVIDWMLPQMYDLESPSWITGSYFGGPWQGPQYTAWLAGNAQRKIGTYQACTSAGTCGNGTTGPANYTWPNLHIDGRPVANRAMEWLTFLHSGPSYQNTPLSVELYWSADACDYYTCGYPAGTHDPFVSVLLAGGNGDGTLVYPCSTARCGTASPIWLPSIRLKHWRDGIQDYEYLLALKNAGYSSFANSQITSWITNSYTFTIDPSGLTNARQALGTKLHQLGLQSSGPSPCDVNGDGAINVADVQLEVNMALSIVPCTNSSGTCTVASVQRVVNAALGGACVSP